MEVDEIHCNGTGKLAHLPKMDDDGDEGERRKGAAAADLGGVGRFYGWPASRIVRVSRASGGKDRHSKVLTSKGLRDRRVRLSVNTAIQFYDLQDRLGYDQPSKAVEWLLKAAAASIAELPPMSSPFPDTPKQLSDEKRSSTAGSDHLCFESAEVDMDGGGGDPRFSQVTKSSGAACSSTSETSKGSGLSLSRSESRIKARERAKGRVAEKEKEKESESSYVAGSLNPISHTTSFTELLSGGINNQNHNNDGGRHWSDYFTSGLLAPRPPQMHHPGNPFSFGVSADHHHHPQELQHVSFLSDLSNHHHNHNGDYNLNFTISSSSADNSSGLAGFSRGTLQSNSSPPQSSMFPQLQRYTNNINSDGSTQGFYTAAPVENYNHHHFQSGFDARYGSNNNNGQKGKGKN